jgi:hypothetical protein
LAASDPGIDQARFPVFFAPNVGRGLVNLENPRDVRRFLTGGSGGMGKPTTSPSGRLHAEMASAGLPGIPGIAPDVRRRVRAADVEVIEVK